ncbi:MAG: molybdenum cofactor guanylyltransferase MobA [Gammaproteobacteria bacterium]
MADTEPHTNNDITGLVLAGGRGTRMGGRDKGLVEFKGKPMIQHVLAALRPQVAEVLISANRNVEYYRKTGCRVVPDLLAGFAGPLAGISAGMHAVTCSHLLVLPCDGPFVPAWLAQRLWAAIAGKDDGIAAAHDGERLHPTFALLPVGVLDDLDTYLAGGGHKIDKFYSRHAFVTVDFSDCPQAFLNINTPEDVEKFECLIEERGKPREE